MGHRGDWKAYRQVFNLCRHYNTDEALVSRAKNIGCFPDKKWEFNTTIETT